jgi:hypothetical protein
MEYQGKSRESVTTNGRAAFYACMWNDFRQAAMDCGWALGLHGSLASDMDIMAMPWTEDATSADDMIHHLIDVCFYNNKLSDFDVHRGEKPNNRVVYTISIWADYYLDINIIESNNYKINDYGA